MTHPRPWLDGAVTRLMLGTAQWGDPYGATNAVGRLSDTAIAGIAAVAHEWEIDSVDTAAGYADAQRRLRPFAHDFTITTKVSGAGDVAGQVSSALDDLGLTRMHAVLIHDWDGLDDTSRTRTARELGRLLDSGTVARVGVSVYDDEGLGNSVEAFTSRQCHLGVVQVPANVLDRRLDGSATLAALAAQGTEVVVRSAFLQGVLLADSGGLADHPDVARFRASVTASGSTPMAACLEHVRSLPWATHVVVGVTSPAELEQVCETWASITPRAADDALASSDVRLIDPRRW
ncbi:MAG TPA: hypothetical protein DCQ36_05400 [Actinobacteria bacterium]|nr:hypothetical protein [Actinomycetota bacterium]